MGIDPVGFQEDNVHSFNRYAYANNNPYRYIDPDGRAALSPQSLFMVGYSVFAIGSVYNAFQPPEKQRALAARLQRALDNIFRSDSAESQPAGGSESGGEPRAGESGGPGAGKAFGDKTKDEIRDRDGNKCVFCKKDTTREPGPDQSNIDHAKPKADDGNNTTNNGQNTCRTCNLDKGRRSTGEFLESGGRRFPQQYGSQP
jgi:HNH endonuclease